MKPLLIEFGGSFPWVRKIPEPEVLTSTPTEAHKSWVIAHARLGWIHHHEADGWVVEYPDGTIRKSTVIENVSPP